MLAEPVNRLVRTAAAVAVLPALLVCSGPQAVDCVVAHVNRRAITLTDVRILSAFRLGETPAPGSKTPTPREVLQKSVDRHVVIELLRENFPISPDDVDARLAGLKARFEPDEWRRLTDTFGITESGIASYLENILQYERMISIRFGQPPGVTVQEIEDYYARDYAPAQALSGLEPKPMSEVLGEIEERLRDRKREAQISDWIRGLRDQADISINEECLQNLK
jgi:hypothetical protein